MRALWVFSSCVFRVAGGRCADGSLGLVCGWLGTGVWMDSSPRPAHRGWWLLLGFAPISGSCGEAWMLVPIFLPFNLNRGSGSWGLALALTLVVIHFHHWEWGWGEITVLRLSTGMTRCPQSLFF